LPNPFPPPTSPRDRTLKNRLGVLFIALIAIGFSVLPVLHAFTKPDSNKDYSRWWRVAMDVRSGASLVRPLGEQSFIYPPASAVIFFAPLSYLGPQGMVIALCLLNFAAHLCVILISVRYATGSRSLNQHPLLYIIPVAVTLPFVWDTYYLGQPNLILLAAILVAFRLLDRHRTRAAALAGTLFAAVTVAKAFPATLIGFLIWRRYWLAAASMIASTLALLLLVPAPIRGLSANAAETWTWVDRMLLSTSGDSLASQPGRAFRSGNQSMVSVIHRLTRDVEAAPLGETSLHVNLLTLTPRAAFIIFIILFAALGLAFITAMPRRHLASLRSRALEYSILLILVTIVSPKAGTYYFCWTLPALTVLTAEVLRAPHRSLRRRALASGLLLAILVMATALTQPFDIYLPQALGATFWGSFILLLSLLAALHMLKHRPATTPHVATPQVASSPVEAPDAELGDLAPFLMSPVPAAPPHTTPTPVHTSPAS